MRTNEQIYKLTLDLQKERENREHEERVYIREIELLRKERSDLQFKGVEDTKKYEVPEHSSQSFPSHCP
jgi:hypothetical protein